MGGACSTYREEERCIQILVGRPLRRLRYRWWDDIKVDLQEVGWGALTRLVWLLRGTGGRFL